MQNKPSPTVYDVDAEIQRQEDIVRRTAKQTGNLYGPRLVPTVKPVLVIKRPLWWAIVGGGLFGAALVWVVRTASFWLFP